MLLLLAKKLVLYIASFKGKVILSESGKKYAQIKHRSLAKQPQTNLNKYVVDFDVKGHRRKHYYGLWTLTLARSYGLKLKRLNDGFVSYEYTDYHFPRC